MPITQRQDAYWSEDVSALGARLGSGPGGLTSVQAAALLAQVGPNSVEETARSGVLRLLLQQFQSPLILILVFAAMVSLALQQWVDATIVLAIVLGSGVLSFYQEYRASAAVAALKRSLAITAHVWRDGKDSEVPVTTLVPGDVVLLSAGNLVPVDGRVLDAADFLVSEAAMTGESFPVEKRPGRVDALANLIARTNVVFMGASVRSGTARVLAVRTGRQTEFGVIAAQLVTKPPESDFARGVRQFGYLLLRVMVGIVLFVLVVNLALHRPMLESLLFAVALAVGLSPELLPAIISVTLSSGARTMSRRGVIVRRLDAIENLGSMDILCTDKTGTLTQGNIIFSAALDVQGETSDTLRQLAFLNASFETGIVNPLDAAIVAAGGASVAGYAKLDEIPYDFIRRRLTIVVSQDGGQPLIITKGAFANVLECCTGLQRGADVVPLDDAARAALQTRFKAMGEQGQRVLGLATRQVSPKVDFDRSDETQMVFRGFLTFADPPKSDAVTVIGDLAAMGIAIKVISGDNRYVTAHLAALVGLNPEAMLTGDQITTMDDAGLKAAVERTQLFVETDPQQKERIVRALQDVGHSVGYLGDGINDAPALHAADVGISVKEAVDVARESADIILLDRDLSVLLSGVADGRRTLNNTLKYIYITTSANFGNMISMALATPFLPFLPLIAKQILLNNFLSDLPSMAISTDRVDAEAVSRPRHWDIAEIRTYMIVFGLISSLFDLITFAALLGVFHAKEGVFQTSWFMISLLTELAVVLVLRTRKPMLRSSPGPVLLWSTLAVGAATLTIPYLGFVSRLFGFVPLTGSEMAVIGVILLAYVSATEVAKLWFFRAANKLSVEPAQRWATRADPGQLH
ncbi:MAG: magnesium-translocating P-type ATPase [Alphaproteobacteria bacterium]